MEDAHAQTLFRSVVNAGATVENKLGDSVISLGRRANYPCLIAAEEEREIHGLTKGSRGTCCFDRRDVASSSAAGPRGQEPCNSRWSHHTGASSDTAMSLNSGCRVLKTMFRSKRATKDGTNKTALCFSAYHAAAKRRDASQSRLSHPVTLSRVAASHEVPRGMAMSTKC